ncbi:MAG: IS3 family transposase [Acidimicrobiales bacterium]
MSRYRHVSAMKAEGFPIEAACRAAEVSTPAYYEWKAKEAAGPSDKELEDACVVAEMRAIYEELDESYGSPRMTKELRRRGFCVNHKRSERLMAEKAIVAVTPRRSIRTTIRCELAPPLPHLVKGDFSIGEPNKRYCGDITYVPTGEGWLFLATVLDLGSRRLAGWAMAGHMRTELVKEALLRALELRGSLAGALFHSDNENELRRLLSIRTSERRRHKARRCWKALGLPDPHLRLTRCLSSERPFHLSAVA